MRHKTDSSSPAEARHVVAPHSLPPPISALGACPDWVGALIPFPSFAFQPSIEDPYRVGTVNFQPPYPLSLLECAVLGKHRVLPGFSRTRPPATPLLSALPRNPTRNFFRMRSSKKSGGRGIASKLLFFAYGFEKALTHEFGHFLGFSHSAVWSAIMFPFAPAPGTFSGLRPTTQQPDGPLGDDDRTGLRVLY